MTRRRHHVKTRENHGRADDGQGDRHTARRPAVPAIVAQPGCLAPNRRRPVGKGVIVGTRS
ncbi:hypothetical protein ABZ642_32975 [Streptomyces sp. NPDC007157]|uniref:hypothetical protein n=1 Tax=Streptomyces sp. NPDC007157 TaxID=3154681 RepID=UPI00340F1931